MKNKNKSGLAGAVVLIGAAAFCLPVHAAETKLLLTTSFDSLKGKFGQTQETTATSITVGATLVGESFRFGVFVPYVSLEGPGVLVGGTVTRASSNSVNKTSGIGDALATVSLDLLGNPAKVGASVGSTLLLKLPTGDEKKGLGTGKADYGFQFDLGYRPAATLGFTAVVGRQFYGESDVVSLLDGNYNSLGVNFAAGQSVLFNVSTTQRDALTRTSAKRKESAVSMVVAVNPKLALQFALTQGNSVSSPDSVVSASLLYQP
ncbi:MAG: hypothetical protein QE278_12640 [Limnobacter sp.]|nr:hypothetical protein [Limnobacter sp.]